MSTSVTVQVPATTANLGPGFDCLALSLDLWNQVEFLLTGKELRVEIGGEGKNSLPTGADNLIARAFLRLYHAVGKNPPEGLLIRSRNRAPLGSGLGSSASAALAGLMGANALLGKPASLKEILRLGIEMEGHPDNIAAALLGGLVIVVSGEDGPLTRRFDLPPLQVVVVTPQIDLPTKAARAALPLSVPLKDAVFNLGRTSLVVEALKNGDLSLLGQVMDDRLHQPYRLPLIAGSQSALDKARQAGAAAAAISGAGPSMIAFTEKNPEVVAAAMLEGFTSAGISARPFILKTTNLGAKIE